jgi:uncharacterized membrane protein YgcG
MRATTTRTTRWIVTVVLAVVVLALASGVAYAAARPAAPTATQPGQTATAAWQACDRLHDTPAMQRMRAQMPAQARQQCDAMHEQMEQTAGQMMSGSGITSGGMMRGGTTSGGMMSR